MSDSDYISLTREIIATRIPSGEPETLPAGASVIVTQALGNSYTVHTPSGLCRVSGEDGDALGREKLQAAVNDGPFSEEQVWAQLRECYDPEIPVNIVDLGLIYSV